MNIKLDFVTVLVFALISQGIFAGIILLLKKGNREANRYLASLTFLLALWLLDTFFRIGGIYRQDPDFYFLPIYYSLGFGPLVYFYTKKLTEEKTRFSYLEAAHFLPVLLQGLFYIYLQTKDYGFRREFWLEVHRPYTYDLELALSFISLIIYLVISRKLIQTYKAKIENSFSSVHTITLQWLNRLHIVLFVLSFIWLLETIGRLIGDFYSITPFSSITISLVIIVIAVGGILQKDLRPITGSLPKEREEDANPSIEISVNPDEVARMQKVMVEEELFLRQELTLKEFAERVNLSPRDASRLINQGLNISFIDFVNQYRIMRFKKLVRSEQLAHLSILGIAYESGFNSKSTFNRVFKKWKEKALLPTSVSLKTCIDTSQYVN